MTDVRYLRRNCPLCGGDLRSCGDGLEVGITAWSVVGCALIGVSAGLYGLLGAAVSLAAFVLLTVGALAVFMPGGSK